MVLPLRADFGADAVYLAIHVDAVGHGALARVFHHQVLVEEAKGLLAGGSRQADEEGVEILQHLPPEVIDRTVALVGDDEIVILHRHARVVAHFLFGLRAQGAVGLP